MINLVTKDQLIHLFAAWGVQGEIPTKNVITVIAFPITAQFPVVKVSKSHAKSTYGKPLFKLEFSQSI